MSHCSLLETVHPEWPNSISPLFLSEGCVCNICDRSHLPSCGSVFFSFSSSSCSVFSSTTTTAPSLSALIPSGTLIRLWSIKVPKHQLFSVYQEWLVPNITGTSYTKYVSLFFNCFRGDRPLQNIQFLIGSNATADLAICFAISSPVVFLKFLQIPSFPSHQSLRSHFLIPLLRRYCACCLVLSICPFKVPRTTLSLVWFFLTFPFHHATFAWEGGGVVPLWAAANFLWDLSFSSWQCSAARFQALC